MAGRRGTVLTKPQAAGRRLAFAKLLHARLSTTSPAELEEEEIAEDVGALVCATALAFVGTVRRPFSYRRACFMRAFPPELLFELLLCWCSAPPGPALLPTGSAAAAAAAEPANSLLHHLLQCCSAALVSILLLYGSSTNHPPPPPLPYMPSQSPLSPTPHGGVGCLVTRDA